MVADKQLDWNTFLNLAQAAGLDVNDPHIHELFDYLPTILPGLKSVHDLDLAGVDPAMVYLVPQE